MITFDLIQRIHRTVNKTTDEGARDEYVRVMKSMYPEAFVEVDISSMVRLEYYRNDGIDIKYRGKKIGTIEIRTDHNNLAKVIIKDKMDDGFKMTVDNYGFKIIMFGSLDIYNFEFHPDADKNRIKEAQ